MATQNDDPEHQYQRERSRIEDADLAEEDKAAILEFLSALDDNDLTQTYLNQKGEQETLAYSSLQSYGRGLRLVGEELDSPLLEAGVAELREVFDEFLDDLADQTVRQRQAGLRKFHRYHDTEVNPDEIPLTSIESSSAVDDRSTLSREDIEALREACNNLRDRALLELFVYTGQRLRAIQTLRLKDIDVDEGVYYLNTDELGLKDAQEVGGKRPLLGAKKHVREWKQNHPTGDPEDYLITALPSSTTESGDYLSKISIYNRLGYLFEEAEVDRPEQQMAHAFRHYFVTVAYRDYNMDASTIKFLIGHKQESTVMESTYQHLLDQDFVDRARSSSGINEEPEEDGDERGLTPEVCPTCSNPLPSDAKACPGCGDVFSPDAESARAKIEEGKQQTDSLEAFAESELVGELLSRNPELLNEADLESNQ